MIITTAIALAMTAQMELAANFAATSTLADLAPVVEAEAKEKEKPQKSEDELYRKATKAIDDERWSDAAALFERIASSDASRADRALYWLGYAQNKAGRAADALASLQKLHQRHPSSKWNDDAKALELEIRQGSGQHVAPEGLVDDDLKLLAISSLMNSDQDRAVTLLDKILRSSSSEEVKERALFVLSQSDSPRAQQLIEQVARGGAGKDLQEKALQSLGTMNTPQHRTLLLDVLQKSNDPDVKSAAMEGLMISGDRQSLFTVASGDPNAEVRSDAIKLLGALHATSDLDRLYQKETSEDVKESIVQAYFIGGDIDRLASLVKTEKKPELRIEIIHTLGAAGGKTAPILLQLWQTESDPEVKEAVIDGLFVQGNAKALIDLARKEQNRDMKRAIVERLSQLNSKEAHDYMLELLQ